MGRGPGARKWPNSCPCARHLSCQSFPQSKVAPYASEKYVGSMFGTRPKWNDGIEARLDALADTLAALAKPSPDTHSGVVDPRVVRLLDDLRADIDARLSAYAANLDQLRTAVAHGIENEVRREKRIAATIRRARQELEDSGLRDPALEAEYGQLSVLDGAGGDGSELPAVSDDLGQDPGYSAEDQPSSVPGVTVAQLQRARSL